MVLSLNQVEWVDEVPAHKDAITAQIDAQGEELRARPGNWAIVFRTPKPWTASNRAGAFRRRGYEAVTRRVGNEHLLYARYVPKERK